MFFFGVALVIHRLSPVKRMVCRPPRTEAHEGLAHEVVSLSKRSFLFSPGQTICVAPAVYDSHYLLIFLTATRGSSRFP